MLQYLRSNVFSRRVTFFRLTIEEKRAIVENGRLKPHLLGLPKPAKKFVRRFNSTGTVTSTEPCRECRKAMPEGFSSKFGCLYLETG